MTPSPEQDTICLSSVHGKNFALNIFARCPERMVVKTFLLYGLLITSLVSSEPDKIYSPVSFQQIVLTQPSCTFKVASSFNLWINSLLP